MSSENKNKGLLISIAAGLIILIGLVVIGNIIVIGDKISSISPLLTYVFYGVIGLLFIWVIIIPVIKVIITPPLKGIRKKDINKLTPTETSEYISDLKKSISLTDKENKDLRSGYNRKETITKILNDRYEEMEKVVKASAVSNFTITAISQNGSLDFISCMVINFRMINEIISKLGRRPSYSQLIKLYISVFSSSLLITALDDIIDDIDFDELLGSVGIVGGKAFGHIISSATNGLMNAFVTLRVGYATIKYIEVGRESFDRKEVRKYAIKSARKQLLSIGKEGITSMPDKVKQMLNKMDTNLA